MTAYPQPHREIDAGRRAAADAANDARPGSGRARRVPYRRTWGLRANDAYAFVALNAFLIGAMWVRHGNLHELGTVAGVLTAVGQLAALYGTFLALIQLVLVSRSPYLDEVFGTDRLLWYHRWGGFLTVWLLAGHFVFTTIGYGMGDGSGVVAEFVTFLTVYPFVLWSFVALCLFIAVAISSVRLARRKLAYGTWYGIHLLMYLAIALAFMHQLLVGIDFVSDPVARLYWIGLYVITIGSILLWRVGQPLTISIRHRLRVANVVEEGPGVVSIYLAGRDLDRLPARAGQWFLFRFLTREGWYRAHPFSLSAAPNGEYLRITVKALGDYTHHLQHIRVGTPVFAEGPYGILTGARRTKERVVLIAGGIGIAPLRALLEELPARPGALTLIYRTSRPEDQVLRDEVEALARRRRATVRYLVGRRGSPEMPRDPLSPAALRSLVPDIQRCDVFVCGPEPMMNAVQRALRSLHVPARRVHLEHFAY
jgi:predicted ferric reductase